MKGSAVLFSDGKVSNINDVKIVPEWDEDTDDSLDLDTEEEGNVADTDVHQMMKSNNRMYGLEGRPDSQIGIKIM